MAWWGFGLAEGNGVLYVCRICFVAEWTVCLSASLFSPHMYVRIDFHQLDVA